MSITDQNRAEKLAAVSQPEEHTGRNARMVASCNFRTAGRFSNEDSRSLNALHASFADQVARELDAYLGTGVEVSLARLDQISVRAHLEEISPFDYIVPLSAKSVFIEFDTELVFSFIELLMGGVGGTPKADRELSEIEEDVMQDVVLLIARQMHNAWRMPNLSLLAGSRIKPALLNEIFAGNERVTVLKFVASFGASSGSFTLILSAAFLNALLKQIKTEEPQKKARLWSFPTPPLRERILDCEMEMTAELPALKVSVRDLIALQPGSVLKLRAPIRNPGMLTAGGRTLFEATLVRNGSQRAAQLGRRLAQTDWKRR